jgi:hypothetical protein
MVEYNAEYAQRDGLLELQQISQLVLAATDETCRREIYQESIARGRQKGGNALGVFKKQGGY